MNRTTNPYWAVLKTYLQRPLFRWLALALVSYPLFSITCDLLAATPYLPFGFTTWSVLDDLFQALWTLCLPVLLAVAWMAHLREQLEGPQRRIVPNFPRPHLRIAAVVFAIMVLLVPLLYAAIPLSRYLQTRFWFKYNSYHDWWNINAWIAGLLVTLTLMTAAAFWASFRSPWIALLLAPIVFIAQAMGVNPWHWYENLYYATINLYNRVNWAFVLAITAIPLELDQIVLLLLSRRLQRLATASLQKSDQSAERPAAATLQPHQPATTLWQRIQARRAAGLSALAPLAAGALIAIILLAVSPLMHDRYGVATQLRVSFILATILPFAVVTCIWAERWPRMAIELLLPASRQQFSNETMLALATDLLQFWLAIAVAAVIPLLLAPAAPIDLPALVGRLALSAILQLIPFAALLWGMRLRSWPAMAVIVGIAIWAMIAPYLANSRHAPLPSPAAIAHHAAFATATALVLAALAYHRWLKANWT